MIFTALQHIRLIFAAGIHLTKSSQAAWAVFFFSQNKIL